jgi:S-DNA-T family DNA segregation ATPase FtsK/SpoIIIE
MPARKTRKTASKKDAAPARPRFWRDPRFRKVVGLGFVLLAVFLGVAMLSYLAQYDVDHDRVHGRGIGMVFGDEAPVSNAMGRFGAWTAHQLMYRRFGYTAFLVAFCCLALGANLLYARRIFRLRRVFGWSAAAIVWGSATFAWLAGPSRDLPGGGLGRYLREALTGALGGVGTGILLAFLLLAAVVAVFDPELQWPGHWFARLRAAFGRTAGAGRAADTPPFDTADDVRQPPTYRSAEDLEPAAEPVLQPRRSAEPEPEAEAEGLTLEVTPPAPVEPAGEAEDGRGPSAEGPEPDTAPEPAGEARPVDDEGWTVAKTPERADAAPGEQPELDIAEPVREKIDAERGSLSTRYDPTLELPDYRYPTLELLEDYGNSDVTVNTEELERNKDQIIETLDNYGIQISKIKATIGPTVTLYEIVPAKGVRISKIKNLEDDIALSLSALGIRIIAPIPGKGTIGIEVPNVNKTIVGMKSQLGSEKFTKAKMDLPICLGKTISGEHYVADLARMPHLLMAGATGQGKSVGINAILASLLYKKHPSELKLVLVDPKKVELSIFQQIERHFLATMPDDEEPIITDVRKVVKTLNALCIEMDTRYDLLKKAQTRNITEYNAKFLARKLNPVNGHRFLPFIVLVIDEFADLIMTAGKEVEMPLARLAQLARAVGIHLVIATQRPSVNIITGLIKANFPARIAFKVTAKVDSRTILDTGGADQLIGRGDLLLSIGSDIVRLQCPFIDTPEVERLVEFIGEQKGPDEPFHLPEYLDEKELQSADDFDGERDVLFPEAARVVVQNQQGSTSLIQRRLKLGYNRAGRLMDQLEAAGIVGPNLGSKARDVLIRDEGELERILEEEAGTI